GPCASGYAALSSAGTADCRQAMATLPIVSLLICSSDEYFVAPLSPEYAGQSRSAPFWPATVHAVETAIASAPSHNSLLFTGISFSRWDYTECHAGISLTKFNAEIAENAEPGQDKPHRNARRRGPRRAGDSTASRSDACG